MRVVVVRNGRELEQHLAALEDLAAAALEPNVFYEPWVMFPAIDAFGAGRDLWFVMIYNEAESGAAPVLCGLFPFERGRRYGGIPIAVFRLWKYGTAYCGLCTPLLRDGLGEPVLAALFEWAKESPDGPALLEWERLGGDGPIYKLLVDFVDRSNRMSLHLRSRTRPLLCRRASAEEFLRLGYSARHLSNNRRKERRLSEQGRVEFYELSSDDDISAWTEDFIRLEAAGWKANETAAVAASAASQRFFASVMKSGQQRGRLMILGLRLDGVCIGAICNLLAAPGSFLYKVAFDERFSRCSPGDLLQQENIRRVHARPEIQWMDSLAEPSFEHVYRWLDRRTIQTVVMSTGRAGGDLVLSMQPAIKWVKRTLGVGGDERSQAMARPGHRAHEPSEEIEETKTEAEQQASR